MKKSLNVRYLTKEGFRNLYVNRLMSFTSVSVLFSCLVLMGIAVMLLLNINSFISDLEAQNVIMVFVSDEADQEQTEQLGIQLRNIENIKECDFISKEQAWEEQIKDLPSLGPLVRRLPDDILPDAYKVTVRDMGRFRETVDQIKRLEDVQNVRENQELATQLANTRNTVSTISLGIILMLLLVSLFIISNTIRVTMFNRRLEISIMKSVGATNGFIRWPFMIEGILLGVIAGLLSLFAVWGIYHFALGSVDSLSNTILMGAQFIPFEDYVWLLFLGFMAIGVFTGIFGSSVSIRRYLKEKEFVEIE